MNRPFPSSPGPLYQNEGSAFDVAMIFHSHAKLLIVTRKVVQLAFLKVGVFGTRKWPIFCLSLRLGK